MEANNTGPKAELKRLTARFIDPAVERQFLDQNFETDLHQLRLAVVLSIIVNLVFALLDFLVISRGHQLALTIRLLWALPFSAAGFAITFVPFFRARIVLVSSVMVLSATLFFAAMCAVSDAPHVYLSGFIIILFFLQLLLPLSFPATLVISIVCTAIFGVSIPMTREISLGPLLTIYAQFLATLIAGNAAVYLLNIYRRNEFLSARQIEQHNRQYYGLLTRILPHSIVKRMEDGEKQIADTISEASVLFADVVGFTAMAAQHSPDTVLAALNGLFAKYDALVDTHRLEKIKTIGDAYMVAGSVPETLPGHVQAMADLALDMLDVTASHEGPDGTPMQVRIGIHVGPVVAGVIGQSRFGYDLWGDTVNVASRIQTSAEPGMILVTDAVHRALADSHPSTPADVIDVKGKGKVETWQLIGRSH